MRGGNGDGLRAIAMKIRFLFGLGFAWLGSFSAAQVPLPDDLEIASAPAGVPAQIAAFLGAWGGDAWQGLPLVLVVEQVSSSGTGPAAVDFVLRRSNRPTAHVRNHRLAHYPAGQRGSRGCHRLYRRPNGRERLRESGGFHANPVLQQRRRRQHAADFRYRRWRGL